MHLGKRSSLTMLVVVLLLASILPLAALQAQDQNVVLSLAVPEWMSNFFTPETMARFEADHPGVKVNLVKLTDEMNYPPAAYEPDKYFEGTAKYVGKADVLSINSYNLTTEGTRAGYFLDLAPLTRGDTSLNADDFIPGAWQAFQWDGGVWALPVSFDVIILSYDPAAFDKAGIPYPSGKWTIDDLADTARKLAVRDADGKITTPGIVAWNDGPLFRSASGETFIDPDSSPSVPQFDKPGLIHVAEVWSKLQADGMFNLQGDPNLVPLRVSQSFDIARNIGSSDKPRNGSLLPGGKAGLSVEAFAVSAGTQYPELAYALVKFVTSEPKIVSRYFGLAPARKSLANAEPGGDTPVYRPKFTPENQAVLDGAVANALPPSEYRFVEYVQQALNEMQTTHDARTALQNAEKKAAATLQMAAEKRTVKAVVVATPIPTPMLKEGEISIKFDMMAYVSPMPNRDLWDQVIKDFTSTDPQVKHIAFDVGFAAAPNELADKFDCFALPYSFVSYMSEENLLPLDSLMSADTSFDKNDIIGSTLAQLQRNNKTWGLPLYIQPQVLRYNTEAFAKAGLKAPDSGWTVDAFNDALKALKVQSGDDAPFIPRQYGSTYLLMLMAAYGGLPFDFRTTPVTLDFTAPANVDAMRQVLDLAKKGYIKYEKLATTGGGSGGGPNRFTFPIYTDSLNMLNYYQTKYPDSEKDPYKLTGYPKGTKFAPVSYDIGAGYISAKSASPEACYRWLSTLSRHPELFWAMPARRSALDSPGVTSQGPDVAAFYKSLDQALQDPSALIIPAQLGSVGDYVLQYFLNRAFDHYVLDNADLEVELKEAQTLAEAYQTCIANIPPNTSATTPKELETYYKQFTNCAIKVDPSLKSLVGEQQ